MAPCFFFFFNWDSLVLDWDSWFFTRWVPGLTITICNKITVHFLNKINWENLQRNKRSTNFLFCHHFSYTFLLTMYSCCCHVVNLGKNTGLYKMWLNTALTKQFWSLLCYCWSEWLILLSFTFRISGVAQQLGGWQKTQHTCRWWYLSAASCFKNLVVTSL